MKILPFKSTYCFAANNIKSVILVAILVANFHMVLQLVKYINLS